MKKNKEGVYTKEFFQKAGKKGGKATAKSKDHAHFQGIGKKGALKRWKKLEEPDKGL